MRPERSDPGTSWAVAGVLLAGGRSRRFGSDKLAADHLGIPLLHHAVLRLHEVCEEVIVVLAPETAEPSMPAGAEVRFARDEVEGSGPLAGTLAGLEAAAGADRAILAGGDMPELQPAVLREMVRASRETGAVAVALSEGAEAKPLPCVLRTRPAAEAAAALLEGGRTSLRELLAAVTTVVVDEPSWTALDPDRCTLVDVDEPGDLDR